MRPSRLIVSTLTASAAIFAISTTDASAGCQRQVTTGNKTLGSGRTDQTSFFTLTRGQALISVNLRSVFLCTRHVLPHMLERGSGKIINFGSQLGQIGGREMVHYSASKGGVIAFTKALAREVSARGVNVNAICPGPILTDMMKDETDEWREAKLAELPIGRFGEVHEVAPTAVFLASDDSSYYVGQSLGPNGGDVML